MKGLKEIDVERADILSKVDMEYLYGKLKSFQITGEEASSFKQWSIEAEGMVEYYEH